MTHDDIQELAAATRARNAARREAQYAEVLAPYKDEIAKLTAQGEADRGTIAELTAKLEGVEAALAEAHGHIETLKAQLAEAQKAAATAKKGK